MYATRPPMKCIGAQCRTPSASITIHAYTGATRPPPGGGNSHLPQAQTSRRAETWRHLSGCLECSAKNQRAGRCPKHSKRAIIRPAVTGHNLMKTIVREHLRPLVELVRQSNPGKHSIGRRGCATGQPLQASLNHQRQPSALCPMTQPLVIFNNSPLHESFEIRSATHQNLERW